MATVEPYESAAGRRYRVRYRKPDHSQTTKRGFKTRREAELFLASVEIGKADGSCLDPTHGRVTIAALGDAWLASQPHLKPSSVAVVESAWRLHVRPVWGNLLVSEVRFGAVQEWVAELTNGSSHGRPRSASLVLRAHGILSAILEAAVRDRRDRLQSRPGRRRFRARSAGSTATSRTSRCTPWPKPQANTAPSSESWPTPVSGGAR